MNTYVPKPVDTSEITLPDDLLSLIEYLAKNNHDNWAKGRIDLGWKWGPQRNDEKKLHPDLIPYLTLTEDEKDFDRTTAIEVLKLIIKAGYKIEKI